MCVKLKLEFIQKFIEKNEILAMEPFVKTVHDMLENKSGLGAEYTSWLNLPERTSDEELRMINGVSKKIRDDSQVFIVIGTGGSYLGARSCIEFLKSSNFNFLKHLHIPKIFFAGNNLSSSYLSEIMEICRDKEVSVNVVSKSGGTLEPTMVFEIFENFMMKKYGNCYNERIFCTTSLTQGNLLKRSKEKNYKIFSIPDDLGGRFSCLTAVGMLPVAVCGGNIKDIILGAKAAQNDFKEFYFNDCYKYAAIRNILYKKGKNIEIIAGYEPRLESLFSWWKQLFGESEGKNNMGIFPSSALFTTDLHSLGQFIQEGSRNIFETVISVKNPIFNDETGNFNKSFLRLNKIAETATLKAHCDGGVPNILLEIEDFSEYTLGYLLYFFEKACAVSGYLLGVNPFDQPGVEFYKRNIRDLL